MSRRIVVFILLVMSISGLAVAQDSSAPLTNEDVVKMTKAGIDEHTLVLTLRDEPGNFDTSSQALIRLKKAGVSAAVMNEMLDLRTIAKAPENPKPGGEQLLQKALDAIAPRDRLAKIHAIRWTGNFTETRNGDAASYKEERIEFYPDRVYLSVLRSTGLTTKLVVTPEFSFQNSGHITRAVAVSIAEPYRQQMKFDPIYVAQHSGDYTLTAQGSVETGGATVDFLKLSLGGLDYRWAIDSQTGRLLSTEYQTRSGRVIRQYSDYRLIDGVYLPFRWRTTESGRTTESTISQYEVNPVVDENLFQRPDFSVDTPLSLKVLQLERVPHEQEVDMEIAVNCQISDSPNVSTNSDSLEDTALLVEQDDSNISMSCNTWEKANFLPQILNAMLVAASDGNAYIIACDKTWRWSKCVPLHVGQVLNATHTNRGIEVEVDSTPGKERKAIYSVLKTQVLQ